MEIITADTAGFCFGVKRAVDKVYECLKSNRKIYTLGPIIHNSEVVKDLESKGVITLKDESALGEVDKSGLVIIRSHGVTKEVCEKLDSLGIEYVDMTCPFVKRIHNTVNAVAKDNIVIIVGNAGHPEVVGIKGWCDTLCYVIEDASEAENFQNPENKPITIVSQTTFSFNKFEELVELFNKKGYDVNVVNTICDATKKRQNESAAIAGNVDIMIVIGDKQSSNSKKLYDICRQKCSKTYFIQTLADLNMQVSAGDKAVGITAGASTPNNIIEEVQNYVRINF